MKTLVSVILALAVTAGFAANPGSEEVSTMADYGADKASSRFAPKTESYDAKDDFNYLALRDHIGPSGVPLGGIGVGCFNMAPDGRFTRNGFNNIHEPMREGGEGCFFSLWQKSGDAVSVRRLVRDDADFCGITGYKHSTYTGLFPRADISFDDGEKSQGVRVSISAYSGLVPHNLKDSTLPVVWFDVTLVSPNDAEVSVALSWEDFLGRNLRDPKSIEGMAGQTMQGDVLDRVNGENWPNIDRIPTAAKPCKIAGMDGVLQYTTRAWKPKKLTFQNYVTQVALMADPQPDGKVTVLTAYKTGDADAWGSFIERGEFCSDSEQTSLSDPAGPTMASGVAVKTKLRAGETKVIRFAVAWFYPIMDVDRESADPASYWSTCDYGRWFHNYFNNMESLVSYTAEERERILRETIEWQTPILESTLPDWLKFKIINSAYTMYTNCILNKAGDFTVLEGGMGGLAGTMDQRISAHPFYQKFFPQLDRSEMQLFADCQDPEGYILHFIGHYYVGMASKNGAPAPTEKSYMLDNTGGWVIQLAKDVAQTGDMEYLRRNADGVRKAMANLKEHIPEGRQIPVGSTTYDDYHHPPIDSYMAGLYLAILKAGMAIGEMLGDRQMVDEYSTQYAITQKDALDMLWNGRFFAHGCEVDGSNRRDDMMFTGQLAGQFVSRYCGWGDVIPFDMARASLISQFKTSLSHTPDYYTNKVWNISEKRGMDRPESQCWPFYLESYTGMAAIQAGYLDDGLDIMKHIQLVHMRRGFTWCQNLWNPDEYSYMTMPVTWFITDVLAGTHLDVNNKTLHIAPVGPIEGQKLATPVFFPSFWGMVSYDQSNKQASLRVIKTFGEKTIRINRLISELIGRPSSERRVTEIPEFVVKQGSTLDLSPYWEQISGAVRREAILPKADEVEFFEVER